MELQLANAIQHHIADQLWEAKDKNKVKEILTFYGVDAVIVLNMMLAAYYDQVDATDLAEEVIARVK